MKHKQASLITLGLGALATTASAQISFSPATVAATGQNAEAAAFADFDGDGFADMAVTTDGNGIQDLIEFHRGNGDGTFALVGSTLLPNSSSPHGVVAADFDGDGDNDVAVGLADTGQVLLLSNLGAFAFVQMSAAATGGLESRSLVGGDLDGDGDVDLAMANRDSNDVSIVLNMGGTLLAAGRVPAGVEPRDVAIGDFNGDGTPDLAASSHDDRTVRILRGVGGGSFAPSQVLTVPFGARPDGMAAADVDGDGDLDVITGTGDDTFAAQNTVSVYIQTAGTLTGPLASPTGGFDSGDIAVADFDGDGNVDVAVGNETSGTISVLGGLGTGTFAPAATIFPVGLPDTLATADIDGNGSADLAATRQDSPGVAIFLNMNSGTGGSVGTNYCTANINSSAQAARLSGAGSASVAQNDLVITCSQMPVDVFGLFVVSQTTDFVPGAGGSQGNLCLGGMIGRYNQAIVFSGAAGEGALAVDWNLIPQPMGSTSASAGDVWNFQCWFRDVSGGNATSNYSDGLSVTTTP